MKFKKYDNNVLSALPSYRVSLVERVGEPVYHHPTKRWMLFGEKVSNTELVVVSESAYAPEVVNVHDCSGQWDPAVDVERFQQHVFNEKQQNRKKRSNG